MTVDTSTWTNKGSGDRGAYAIAFVGPDAHGDDVTLRFPEFPQSTFSFGAAVDQARAAVLTGLGEGVEAQVWRSHGGGNSVIYRIDREGVEQWHARKTSMDFYGLTRNEQREMPATLIPGGSALQGRVAFLRRSAITNYVSKVPSLPEASVTEGFSTRQLLS